MIQMQVTGVFSSSKSAYPQVVLEEVDGATCLPIVIGRFEAAAISMAQSEQQPLRPISYDLARSILESVGVHLRRIEITELHEGTYFAAVHLVDREGRALVMDSRPSDAIALALRMSAPIFASRDVLREAGYVRPESGDSPALVQQADVEQGRVDGSEQAAEQGTEGLSRLEFLRQRLLEAVADEGYEEAARLRDEIAELEERDRG